MDTKTRAKCTLVMAVPIALLLIWIVCAPGVVLRYKSLEIFTLAVLSALPMAWCVTVFCSLVLGGKK